MEPNSYKKAIGLSIAGYFGAEALSKLVSLFLNRVYQFDLSVYYILQTLVMVLAIGFALMAAVKKSVPVMVRIGAVLVSIISLYVMTVNLSYIVNGENLINSDFLATSIDCVWVIGMLLYVLPTKIDVAGKILSVICMVPGFVNTYLFRAGYEAYQAGNYEKMESLYLTADWMNVLSILLYAGVCVIVLVWMNRKESISPKYGQGIDII